MMEMDYLYWYRRGDQPVLSRTKTVRPEINNKVVENHASEIVDVQKRVLPDPAGLLHQPEREPERHGKGKAAKRVFVFERKTAG